MWLFSGAVQFSAVKTECYDANQDKSLTVKTPQSSKAESKSLKRKLFNTGSGGALSEEDDKKTTPKRRKSCASLPGEGSPSPGSTTPKTPASGGGRLTVPLSERQQMALLMQMTAETQGDTSPQPSSPQTPCSTVKRTPLDKKVNKRNDKGETPLHIAAIRGDCKTSKKLIKIGADVNIKDYAGWTPLHEACNHGCLDVARLLLKAGANVNVQGLDNDTPLHDASINGHHKLVELLLRHGANPVQSNAKGKSALDIAASPDIKILLKKEIIASSSESSGLDEARSPTSPESNVSDRDDDRPAHDSQELDFAPLPTSSSGRNENASYFHSTSGSGDKRSPSSQYMKMDKFGSPRLTLKFQHIKSKDERRGRGAVQKLNSRDPQYKSYSVTVESSEDYNKMFSPSHSSSSSQDSDLYDPHLDSTVSSVKDSIVMDEAGDRLAASSSVVSSADQQHSHTTLSSTSRSSAASVYFHHQKLNIKDSKSELSISDDVGSSNKVSSISSSGHQGQGFITSQFEDISDVEDGEEPMEVDTTTAVTSNVTSSSSTSLQLKLSISHSHIPDAIISTSSHHQHHPHHDQQSQHHHHQQQQQHHNQPQHQHHHRTFTPMDTSEASPAVVATASSSSFSVSSATTAGLACQSTETPSAKTEKHKHKESHQRLEDSGGCNAAGEKLHASPKSDKDNRLSPKVDSRQSPNKERENRFSPKQEKERGSPKPKFERELRASTKNDKEKLSSKAERERSSPKSTDSNRDCKSSPRSDKESRWSPKSDSAKWEKLKIDTGRNSPNREKDKEKLSPKSDKDRPTSLKVPPLKIILPQKSNSGEGGESLKALLMKPALPYVLNPTQEGEDAAQSAGTATQKSDNQTPVVTGSSSAVCVMDGGEGNTADDDKVMSTTAECESTSATQPSHQEEPMVCESSPAASTTTVSTTTAAASSTEKEKSKDQEEQPPQQPSSAQPPQPASSSKKEEGEKEERRLTRSAVRSQQQQQAAAAAAASESGSNGQKDEKDKDKNRPDSTDDVNSNLHPRKRKLRHRQDNQQGAGQAVDANLVIPAPLHTLEKPVNPFELYLDIRKQIAQRRNNMFVVQPKAPQGFKDYLMVSCNYVLEGNSASRLAAPMLSPPNSVTGPMRELFIEQEKSRYRLRLQHVIEREKLMLSIEQEIVRVHCRAARALANQNMPFSVCTVLKHDEFYNSQVVDHETHHDDKDKSVRGRYNGRQFLSWLQDVDDKYDKIKESLLLRHHHEAESLQAVQKLEWQWKVMDLGLSENKNTSPFVDDLHVPMVQVNDDFDLLPA